MNANRNDKYTEIIVARRLAKAYEALNEFITTESDLKESKEYELAVTLLELAKVELNR